MAFKYSPNFQSIINNKKLFVSIMKQSGFIANSIEDWEINRRFIASAIDSDGTILDIGCANGLLLRTLQEWSKHKLEPYGIDKNQKLIDKTNLLFNNKQNNFATLDLQEIFKIKEYKLPTKYNYIYWSMPPWDFSNKTHLKIMKNVLQLLSDKGKLILGFYDLKSSKLIPEIIKNLTRIGFTRKVITRNPGKNELLLYGYYKKQ